MKKAMWIIAAALVLTMAGCGAGEVSSPAPESTETTAVPESTETAVAPESTENAAAPENTETAAPSPEESGGAPQEYRPAPGFTVYTLAGEPVELSDFLGKPVVVNFWASRCGPCLAEMPDFQAAYEQYGDRVHFLMINRIGLGWDTVEAGSAFIAESGYTFPVYYDAEQSAAEAYGVSAVPLTCFIDSEGNWVAYWNGMLSMDLLMQGIGMILPEQTDEN